jgi:hypothetical protein
MVTQQPNGTIQITCDWCAYKLSDYLTNSTDLPKDFLTAYRVAESFGFETTNGTDRCSYCAKN